MRAVLVVLATVACGGGADEQPPILPGTEPPPCEVVSEGWRIVAVDIPDDAPEWMGWAVDLDGDGRPDNALGAAAMILADDAPVEAAAETVLRDPTFAWGLNVERCADAAVDHLRVELIAGTWDEASRTFFVELGGIPAVGASSEAALGRGLVPVSIFADVQTDPDVTEWAEAYAFAAFVDPTEDDVLTGRLAMGFRAPGMQALAARALARTAAWAVANDPGCPEACTTQLGGLAIAFDRDEDGTLTVEEILENDGFHSLLGADLDLFAADVFWPGHDGDEDALALAFRFGAERVTLWPPQ